MRSTNVRQRWEKKVVISLQNLNNVELQRIDSVPRIYFLVTEILRFVSNLCNVEW
jgi:hypothetical protein